MEQPVTKNRYHTLDTMIAYGLSKYYCDPWCAEPKRGHFDEMEPIHGSVHYGGKVFVVVHHAGNLGLGGMDEGSPRSLTVHCLS